MLKVVHALLSTVEMSQGLSSVLHPGGMALPVYISQGCVDVQGNPCTWQLCLGK